MTRKLFLCFLVLTALFAAGCGNDEDAFCEGRVSIDDYLDANPQEGDIITDDSGLKYIILDPGTPQRPELTSFITINYDGRLTNDMEFDSGVGATFILGQLIEGWQIGLRKIGAGGMIRLFIPSELGYGARQSGDICPNSDLIFDVTVIEWRDN